MPAPRATSLPLPHFRSRGAAPDGSGRLLLVSQTGLRVVAEDVLHLGQIHRADHPAAEVPEGAGGCEVEPKQSWKQHSELSKTVRFSPISIKKDPLFQKDLAVVVIKAFARHKTPMSHPAHVPTTLVTGVSPSWLLWGCFHVWKRHAP